MRQGSFTVSQAARACNVSRSTLYRRMEQLAAHGATQGATGWDIPVSALVATGLLPKVSAPDTPPGTLGASQGGTVRRSAGQVDLEQVATLETRLREAETQIQLLQAQKEAAEAIARERERVIDAQRVALRALEAAPSFQETREEEAPETVAPTKDLPLELRELPKQRGFLSRLFKKHT